MSYTIINLLNQFEFIDFLYFEASLIDNIHISLAKIVILFLVFIMILASYKLNRLVSNKWSISKESMYALILKGLLIHGLKFLSALVPSGCPFALLPILVGLRYNYLYLSLKVVKLKTKFHSPNFKSNSGAFYYFIKLSQWRNILTLDIVGNLYAHTARNYSTCTTPCRDIEKNYNSNLKMNPWFLTGFTDGEGCFHVSVIKYNEFKLGWKVQPNFQITLHKKDYPLLKEIKNFFGIGSIYLHGNTLVKYSVKPLKDLGIIIKHFKKYQLQTQKCANFELWMQVFELIERRKHLTLEGLHKILAIRVSMNWGLSEELKLAFPGIVPVVRPLV